MTKQTMQCIPIIVRLPLQLLRVNHCLFSAIWVIEVLTRLNVIAGAAYRGGFHPNSKILVGRVRTKP